MPLAEVTFTALLPAPLAPGETMVLGVLDEVTGLGLNPALYPMNQVDAQRYTLTLPLVVNSVVKYRYYRKGAGMALEDTAAGSVVRYRLYHVTGPGGTEDRVASWSDTPFQRADRWNQRFGGGFCFRASGRQHAGQCGRGVHLHRFARSVRLERPAGWHAYAGGLVRRMACTPPFSRGAAVAAGLMTNAPISVAPAPTVQVTFIVNTPADTVRGAPVRLAGNLLQLGNTFADLSGGVSTLATRMPTLSPLDDLASEHHPHPAGGRRCALQIHAGRWLLER